MEITNTKNIKLWALINNAGVELINGPDDFLTLEHYQAHFDVNFYGTLRLTKAFKSLYSMFYLYFLNQHFLDFFKRISIIFTAG